MTHLHLAEAAQLADGDLECLQRITEGVEPLPGQPPTYDPVRLALAIGNFIACICEPSFMAVDRVDFKK